MFAVGSLEFRTKGDAVAYFRQLLRRYTVGSLIEGEDAIDLAALLNQHPRRGRFGRFVARSAPLSLRYPRTSWRPTTIAKVAPYPRS